MLIEIKESSGTTADEISTALGHTGDDVHIDDSTKRNVETNTDDVRGFLARIGLTDFIEVFETEMVDMEVLKEMSHEDLKSVGVKTFGQRHKILKELKSFKPTNIVDSLLTSLVVNVLACNSCEKTFTTPRDLNEHALNHMEVESCPSQTLVVLACNLQRTPELNIHT